MKKINDFTIIGKIINTRGIKGELKVFPMTSVVERYSDLDYVFVGEELEKYTISKVSYTDKFVYIKFKEFNNINEVLKFKEKFLYVEDENRIKLDDDTFFISDLISSKVYNMEKEYIGELVDVMENPVNDVYIVKSDDGDEYLIPALKLFVKKVDVENKIIIIDPIEGMLNEI